MRTTIPPIKRLINIFVIHCLDSVIAKILRRLMGGVAIRINLYKTMKACPTGSSLPSEKTETDKMTY